MSGKRHLRTGRSGPSEDIFLAKIKSGVLPKHVAIIMDGNGRWARKRGKPRLAGHRAGVKNIRTVIEAAQDVGIKYLTLYVFSVDNWQRPESEVTGLMQLLKDNIKPELENIQKNNIKLRILGRWRELDPEIVKQLKKAIDTTKNNDSGYINLALNYGSRAEIVDAVKKIVEAVQAGDEDIADINEKMIEKYLYTFGIPSPDLLIRTSGEMRISDFLLWQIAYSEIWVTPVLWPDFSRKEFFDAIYDFQKRRRRFGGLDDTESDYDNA